MNTSTPSAPSASVDEKITLVIPVYNEEGNVLMLYEQILLSMNRQERPWELLLVDDGSTDGSLEQIRKIAQDDSRVRYLSFEANCGQSAAMAAGFREASGSVIVTLDADLQNDPADIPAMLNMLDQGHDMVCGWRVNRQDTQAKRWASKLANRLRNWVIGDGVHDTGCSLKAFKTVFARELPVFKGMHRFIPALMQVRGASVVEMPVNHRARMHGVSKYGIVDRALSTSFDLIGVYWLRSRYVAYRIKERN